MRVAVVVKGRVLFAGAVCCRSCDLPRDVRAASAVLQHLTVQQTVDRRRRLALLLPPAHPERVAAVVPRKVGAERWQSDTAEASCKSNSGIRMPSKSSGGLHTVFFLNFKFAQSMMNLEWSKRRHCFPIY